MSRPQLCLAPVGPLLPKSPELFKAAYKFRRDYCRGRRSDQLIEELLMFYAAIVDTHPELSPELGLVVNRTSVEPAVQAHIALASLSLHRPWLMIRHGKDHSGDSDTVMSDPIDEDSPF